MQIIQQLRAGTVHFQVNTDGTESFATRPPTHLNLQAARVLEELLQACNGLERANQTLAQQLDQTTQELDAQRNLVQKLLADAQQQGTGAAPEHTEAASPKGVAGVETQTGSAPAST